MDSENIPQPNILTDFLGGCGVLVVDLYSEVLLVLRICMIAVILN